MKIPNKKDFFNFILNYKWILIIFVIFLIFQIYQSGIFFWDPLVYQLNGNWFCGEQVYFEFLRPPLPAAVHCLVGLGENSILLSNIVASFVYLFAVILLYKKEIKKRKIDQLIFALFIFLIPQILVFGNFGGDFFALSFLIIALTIKPSFLKGVVFGLATLSRYNFLLYFILLINYKKFNIKEFAKVFGGFFITWLPWLIYNYFNSGNFLFSVEETIYLNLLLKGVLSSIELNQILLISFFVVVLFLSDYKNNLKSIFAKAGILALVQFILSGIKETRFLNVFVPFQAIKISELSVLNKNYKIFFIFVIILMFIYSLNFLSINRPVQEIPQQVIDSNCRVMSDNWVYFYKFGIVAEPLPGPDSYYYFLDKGVSLVFYDKNNFSEIGDFNLIETNDYILVLSTVCASRPNKYELLVWRGNNQQD